ncbi:hypothetical protein DTO164E3_6316 [Paecilomyces variotii]|nr:hypothetical protein DTO164E3_6316 [Paecilomyces variotii]KAJ9288875.1 hypothetical protein DTO021C3_3675 [Paecilomyces variotii]KAJ9407834.1 hypothetical protein DTO045G8_4301 [Paecilomyces variotii]
MTDAVDSDHWMQPDPFFTHFANAVAFSPDFRGARKAYVAGDFQEAAAIIKLRPDSAGTPYTSSPYSGWAPLDLAGFIVNRNPNTSRQLTYALMGSELRTGVYRAGQGVHEVKRISRWEETTAFCTAYVFDTQTDRYTGRLPVLPAVKKGRLVSYP